MRKNSCSSRIRTKNPENLHNNLATSLCPQNSNSRSNLKFESKVKIYFSYSTQLIILRSTVRVLSKKEGEKCLKIPLKIISLCVRISTTVDFIIFFLRVTKTKIIIKEILEFFFSKKFVYETVTPAGTNSTKRFSSVIRVYKCVGYKHTSSLLRYLRVQQ